MFYISTAIYIHISDDIVVTLDYSILATVAIDEPAVTPRFSSFSAVTIEEPGYYYVWETTMYTSIRFPFGAMCKRSGTFPEGLVISLKEKRSNNPVDFVTKSSGTSSHEQSISDSIGHFKIDEPGIYIFSIYGKTQSTQLAFQTLSLGKSISNPSIVHACFIACIALIIITVFAGMTLIIVGSVNYLKARK